MLLQRLGRSGALAVASLLVAATSLYAFGWTYYVGSRRTARLGVETTYSLATSSLPIEGVEPGAPAEAAGVRAGDRVVAINGERLTTRAPLYDHVYRGTPGERVRLTVDRPGASGLQDIEVVLGRPPVATAPFSLQTIAEELLRLYPVGFLTVMALLLLLRPQDRNAWLVSLLFAGFIAAAPLDPALGHPWLRRFAVAYKVLFNALIPALFYWVFAVFPARSPVDVKFPRLKVVLLALGLAIGLPLAILVARAGTWDPLERILASPVWRPVGAALASAGLVSFLLGIASLLWSYRAAPDPIARRRTGVIVWGTIAGVTPITTLQILSRGREPYDLFPFWIWAPAVFALFLLPFSYAYAVIKHRAGAALSACRAASLRSRGASRAARRRRIRSGPGLGGHTRSSRHRPTHRPRLLPQRLRCAPDPRGAGVSGGPMHDPS